MANQAVLRRLKRQSYIVIADAVSHFNDDDGWAMASHVALTGLMALFPFLIFVAALAGFIGHAELADQAADLILETWPESVAKPIAAEIHNVLTVPRSDVLTISILVAVYLASNGVEGIRTALNRAYRARETRSFVLLRLQSILFVLIGAVTSLALAFLGVLGPLIWTTLQRWVPAIAPYRSDFELVRFAVTGGLLVTGLVLAHLILPARRPPPLRLWPGILLTLLLWVVATVAFAAYLESFADYVSTYAGLASVVTAIFFLYLVAVVMIFGAEFNAALGRLRRPGT